VHFGKNIAEIEAAALITTGPPTSVPPADVVVSWTVSVVAAAAVVVVVSSDELLHAAAMRANANSAASIRIYLLTMFSPQFVVPVLLFAFHSMVIPAIPSVSR
jgi:hypothetical protein